MFNSSKVSSSHDSPNPYLILSTDITVSSLWRMWEPSFETSQFTCDVLNYRIQVDSLLILTL